MAVFAILKGNGSKSKVDARTFLSERESGDLDVKVIGYTLTIPGVDPVELDANYRPTNAADTARCCQIWTSNQSGWTKESRDFLRLKWSACSAFTVNRITKIAGAQGYGCSAPTTLAAVVNSNKRGDIFAA